MEVAEVVAELRALQRKLAERLDAPEPQATGLSATERRVIEALAAMGPATATRLGAELGLDAGYLSRVVQRLAERRLVARADDRADRRRIELSLTERGEDLRARLDAAGRMAVLGLGEAERARLIEAVRTVQVILTR